MDVSMRNGSMLWTAESVTEGHPDKVADAISDAIVDAFLNKHPDTRVAAETFLPSAYQVVLGGEIGIPLDHDKKPLFKLEDVDVIQLVREVIREIGYTDLPIGFDGAHCIISCNLKAQSGNIAQGVLADEQGASDASEKEQGAGDQGMMFGYACRDTPTLMPAPIFYAHKLAARLSEIRRQNEVPYLRPDGKSQITLKYENGVPVTAIKIVLAAQHGPEWTPENDQRKLKELLRKHVVEKVIPESFLDGLNWEDKFTVNGTGTFERGGPAADAGLTGRKIIVDTYGGMAPHGGGAFSGKDPTKVDRSGNYYGRYCAKNIVAARLAERCQVRVAYAIGESEPIGLDITTFGTEQVDLQKIYDAVTKCFDFTPAKMIDQLNLRRPIYRPFAAYGHFGREEENATWEKTDKVEDLRSACGI